MSELSDRLRSLSLLFKNGRLAALEASLRNRDDLTVAADEIDRLRKAITEAPAQTDSEWARKILAGALDKGG